MNIDKMRERYLNDAHFSKVVNLIHSLLYEGHLTISELRDAATFAGFKFEAENARPILMRRTSEQRTEEA